ncbi:MAG: DEAD/DEAH box helicase [Spirochaetales bacterium]|nr:DEAD/DEAH box helicase [Spirochaetales bacterium]
MYFKELGLKAELLSAIHAQGYKSPTPVQEQAIPEILSGRDVLAGAQTGTGKTAAFTLPILQLLSEKSQGGFNPRALILAPTRELAAQVAKSVAVYGKNLSLHSTVVFGGVNINPQIRELRRGTDILTATPGRLLDHAGQRTLDLSEVEILVLDEADRMLDMGFIHDIRRILKLLPHGRQNLLFSATYPESVRQLADSILHNPKLIQVSRRNTAVETVTQVLHPVARTDKFKLLTHLIKQGDVSRALVFIRTKYAANNLAQKLARNSISAAAIHGNKSQSQRTRALADFKKGAVSILVATDIASRGLDINQLPQVVNYDLPGIPEDYIHRIGRTGRAGARGLALSLVSHDETKLLANIEKLLCTRIQVREIPGFKKEEAVAGAPSFKYEYWSSPRKHVAGFRRRGARR